MLFIYRLKLSALIALLIIILAACGVSDAPGGQDKSTDQEQSRRLEFLNQSADEMYDLIMKDQVIEARGKLLQISDQITRIPFTGVASVEGINALTETITQAKRVFNAVAFSPEEGQFAAAKVRLATDALIHANQPMWLQYYKVLQNDLDLMEQGVAENKRQTTIDGFNKLVQHVALIKPSLYINRDSSEIEKLDSQFSFLRGELNSDPLQASNVQRGIRNLQVSVDELFRKKRETAAYLPLAETRHPILWTLGIGVIIVSVLSFAGWRMFHTGRGVVTVKRKEEG